MRVGSLDPCVGEGKDGSSTCTASLHGPVAICLDTALTYSRQNVYIDVYTNALLFIQW